MSETDLKNEENTSDTQVGRVLTLGIRESISASDVEPQETEIKTELNDAAGNLLYTATVNGTIGVSASFNFQRGYPPIYWTADKHWQPDYNWVKPTSETDDQRLEISSYLHFRERNINVPTSRQFESFALSDDWVNEFVKNSLVDIHVKEKIKTVATM